MNSFLEWFVSSKNSLFYELFNFSIPSSLLNFVGGSRCLSGLSSNSKGHCDTISRIALSLVISFH